MVRAWQAADEWVSQGEAFLLVVAYGENSFGRIHVLHAETVCLSWADILSTMAMVKTGTGWRLQREARKAPRLLIRWLAAWSTLAPVRWRRTQPALV